MSERVVIQDVRGGRIQLRDVFSEQTEYRDSIDLIVDWRGLAANEHLYDTLKQAKKIVHRIGDCVAPRTLEIATSEAFDVANAI